MEITEKDVYGQEPVFPEPYAASSCKPEASMITIVISVFENKAIVSVPGGYWRVYPKLGCAFSFDFTDIIKIQTQ